MFKRILPIALLLCALPVLANAAGWFFSTQARSAGGTISSPNMSNQSVTDGPIFRPYTTSAPLGVTVSADPGFSISHVTVNNVPVSLGSMTSFYSTTVHGMTDQSVTATFVTGHLAVNAVNPGGTVTPPSVGNINYGDTLQAPLVFRFTPATGCQITGISNLPNDPKVTHSSFSPGINKAVTVTFATGYVFNSAINLQASIENLTPSINFVLPQTVVAGGSVSLNAAAVNVPDDASYTWSYLSGPANTALVSGGKVTSTTSFTPGPAIAAFPAAGASATFTAPGIPGQYKFKVVVSSAGNPDLSSLAVVNVVTSVYSAGRNQCQFCHTANGIGSPQLFSNWSASAHRANAVSCDKCHAGVNTGGHPGTTSGNVCAKCHSSSLDAQGNYLVENHPFAIGATICTGCHDPHSTIGRSTAAPTDAHFNNVTGAGYPASYVTSRATCMDCHFNSAENATVRGQWAGSPHAAVKDAPFTAYDFKARSGCVQCHTTTGFIAYSTGKMTAAWGGSSDKTKEVLTCVGCHSDIATGKVRTVTPARPYADETDYQNRNVATSNVCMDCHSGRNNGTSILVKVGPGFDLATSAFIAPHYLSAGGTLHGKSGYQFPGRSYAGYSSNSHRAIGMMNTMATGNDGPCVSCHMSSPTPHGYQPVSLDQTGAITAITATGCANCHATALSATALDADRVAFNNSLDVLKAQLAASLHPYSPDYPYFGKGGWGAGQAGANIMGAAFNYKLLLAEPGAYAHNSAYAKQLIVDSIDAAANGGTVTGDISSALAALIAADAITQDQADRLNSYKSASPCASCHTNTSGSHSKHLNNSVGCVSCHSQTAASNTALISGTQKHLNGINDVVFAAGGSYLAGTCSNVYCHSNGAGSFTSPAWGVGTSNCSFCHPIASLGGAHAAHVGTLIPAAYGDTANNSTATEYRFGCGSCHPTDLASHSDGFVEVTLVPTSDGSLRSKNNPSVVVGGIGNTGSGIAGNSRFSVVCSASYCHSNGGVGGALIYANSPDWYAGHPAGDSCAMCHSNSPASGAHAAHAVGIHYGQIYDGSGALILGHGDPAQSTTINCDLCHSATVTNNANDNNATCASCHATDPKGTPALDKTRHLNGSVDVVFKGINLVTKAQVRPASFAKYSGVWARTSYKAGAGSFDTAKLSLSQGGWDGNGKNCSNVACHNAGMPNWNAKLSCVDCHSGL
jgi:predicted CxxxxCH...CXXCH cytochrome family protein